MMKILHQLKKLEEEYNIEILFASEVGSRGKGMITPTSDYDVGFIFKKKDIMNYLGCENTRDSINLKIDDIDYIGQDVRKSIKLLKKGNYNIMEWLYSRTIYIENNNLKSDLAIIYCRDFNKEKMIKHHSNLGLNNINKKFKRSVYSYLICKTIDENEFIDIFSADILINNLYKKINFEMEDDGEFDKIFKTITMTFDYIFSLSKGIEYEKENELKELIEEELIRFSKIKPTKLNNDIKIYDNMIKKYIGV